MYQSWPAGESMKTVSWEPKLKGAWKLGWSQAWPRIGTGGRGAGADVEVGVAGAAELDEEPLARRECCGQACDEEEDELPVRDGAAAGLADADGQGLREGGSQAGAGFDADGGAGRRGRRRSGFSTSYSPAGMPVSLVSESQARPWSPPAQGLGGRTKTGSAAPWRRQTALRFWALPAPA